MMKFYLIAFFLTVIGCAYLLGVAVGKYQCKVHYAEKSKITQMIYLQKMEETNAYVNRTAVSDIRNVLHKKYTISD